MQSCSSSFSQSEIVLYLLLSLVRISPNVHQYHSSWEPAFVCIEPVSHTCYNLFLFAILIFFCYRVWTYFSRLWHSVLRLTVSYVVFSFYFCICLCDIEGLNYFLFCLPMVPFKTCHVFSKKIWSCFILIVIYMYEYVHLHVYQCIFLCMYPSCQVC